MTIDHMPFLYELPLTACCGTDRMVARYPPFPPCPHTALVLAPLPVETVVFCSVIFTVQNGSVFCSVLSV